MGISGWRYPPWRGTFYPKGLPQRSELEYASARLDTLEINGTFYSMQRPSSFLAWHDAAPPGFVFSVKGGKFVTHVRMLRDVRGPLCNFFASGVLALGEKLGPFLWQTPEWLHYNEDVVEEFLGLLPKTVGEALGMAADRDEWMEDRSWTAAAADGRLRHAMEVRHGSFETERFRDQLRRHGVAAATTDSAGKWPLFLEQTSDFSYVRLHGLGELYAGGYTEEALDTWEGRVRGWMEEDGGRDVFVYFDDDAKVRAPHDAMALAGRLRRPGAS